MSTIFFSISTYAHYRVPNITKIQHANSKFQKEKNRNKRRMHMYRAVIIVKKKKKRKGCARFPVEKRGWIYVEGWIDKSDGSTDGSWLYRSEARKRREESRREGERIFREKWETDERGRIYRCVRAYIRDFQATTTTLIQLISPFSIQPPIPPNTFEYQSSRSRGFVPFQAT